MDNKNIKCCVYTRDLYERPYIYFFIEHYVKLGFDKIIILKTNDHEYKYDFKYNSYIEVHEVENLANETLPKHDYLIKESDYDWVLCVDVDEILLLNKKYKNIKSYINDSLKNNENINIFFFRWGLIEKYDNLLSNNIEFNYIINNYSIYNNHHIKSMAKVSELESINHPHYCKLKNQNIIYFENNIINPKVHLHVQCFSDNSYNDNILIHLHTRSVNNIVIKSLSTLLNTKKIKNKLSLIELINNYQTYDTKLSLLDNFKKAIGAKAGLPFHHSNQKKINKKLLENYKYFEYEYSILEESKENDILKVELEKLGICYDNYKEFIKNINWVF